MSALTPHIASHRAMADALKFQEGCAVNAQSRDILSHLWRAHKAAADALEEQEKALERRMMEGV